VIHPDQKELPAYIGKLQTPSGVKDFADWLKQHYPGSFKTLQADLNKRYREVNRKKGMTE
jgi:hypothetical protein